MTIVLDNIFNAIEDTFTDSVGLTSDIDGGRVFYAECLRAMLTHLPRHHYVVAKQSFSSFDQELDALLTSIHPITSSVRRLQPGEVDSITTDPQLVFLTTTEGANALAGLRRALGRPDIPVVCFLHAAEPNWLLPHLARWWAGGCYPWDAMVCSSEAGRKALTTIFSLFNPLYGHHPHTPLIPLGVDASLYSKGDRQTGRRHLGISDDTVCLLHFSRFEPAGKADVFALLAFIADTFETYSAPLRLVLAGNDHVHALAPAAMEYARNLGIANAVTIITNPSRSAKIQLLAAADIALSVNDGVRETFGLTLLEAMAAGLPVIAADWSGSRDIVQHGRSGFLIPTMWLDICDAQSFYAALLGLDSDRFLASATLLDLRTLQLRLSQLVQNVALRRHLGTVGLNLVRQHFDWAVITKRYEQLWYSLLQFTRTCPCNTDPGLRQQSLFAHYPTEVLTDDDLILCRYRETTLGLFAQAPTHFRAFAWFREDIARSILAITVTAIPISTVIAMVSKGSTVPGFLVRLHVGRLLKYGLLQRVTRHASPIVGSASSCS